MSTLCQAARPHRKKGVPWDRDTGMPKEGSATALKGWGQDGGTGR